jgi:phosphoglucomutase
MTSREKYEEWLRQRDLDDTLRKELLAVADDEEAIEDLFYKDLSFGTSGLRGKMGPGTTGMNVHVVARATQGVADYLNSLPMEEGSEPSCGIAYDSRINSRQFAEVTARVLCANGIRVYMYREISPVASLSFAIRKLGLTLGIMITASHNPKEYNGYKVYDENGCQIVGEAPTAIMEKIEQLGYFDGIRGLAFGLESSPLFQYIDDSVLDEYMKEALAQSLPAGGMEGLTVVYSPLHGTGNRFVTHTLLKAGVGHLYKVKTQEAPDGTFPGCPIPNPERIDVFKEGTRICDKVKGDLVLATDPDCDRVGVAVPMGGGRYWYPTGNQIGILLCQYLCANRDLP